VLVLFLASPLENFGNRRIASNARSKTNAKDEGQKCFFLSIRRLKKGINLKMTYFGQSLRSIVLRFVQIIEDQSSENDDLPIHPSRVPNSKEIALDKLLAAWTEVEEVHGSFEILEVTFGHGRRERCEFVGFEIEGGEDLGLAGRDEGIEEGLREDGHACSPVWMLDLPVGGGGDGKVDG